MQQVFSLGALTAAQLGLGLLVQIAVIAIIGAGEQTDSWIAAQAIPLVLFGMATIACQGAWQAEFAVNAGERETFLKKQRTAHGQVLVALGPVIVALVVTASLWTHWLFPGFTESQRSLTAEIAQILLVGTFLNAHIALYTTALRARLVFVLPEAIGAAGSVLALVLTVLLIGRAGVVAAAWASLARSVMVGLILFFLSGRALPSIGDAWRDSAAWRRMKPLLLSSSIAKSSPLVDRFFGSLAPAGALTTFNLALTGMTALANVMERALSTVPTSGIGRLVQSHDIEGIRRTYRLCLRRATLASAAVLLVLFALWPFWTELAHFAIGVDGKPAADIWSYCVLLAAFLVPASSGSAVTFSFYALGDTLTPARISVIGFLASVALKALGFHLLGILGIVIGILVHYLGNLSILWWLLERRLRLESTNRNRQLT